MLRCANGPCALSRFQGIRPACALRVMKEGRRSRSPPEGEVRKECMVGKPLALLALLASLGIFPMFCAGKDAKRFGCVHPCILGRFLKVSEGRGCKRCKASSVAAGCWQALG